MFARRTSIMVLPRENVSRKFHVFQIKHDITKFIPCLANAASPTQSIPIIARDEAASPILTIII